MLQNGCYSRAAHDSPNFCPIASSWSLTEVFDNTLYYTLTQFQRCRRDLSIFEEEVAPTALEENKKNQSML
jgi:hypothetical protein